MENEKKMSPQGSVIEPVKRIGGTPVITPITGYDGHYPVQFSDETDAMFAGRVAMFEGSLASARQNAAGGKSLEQGVAALKAKFDADVLALKEADKINIRTVNGVPAGSSPADNRVVKSKDGSTRGVDAGYVLQDGEKFA